MTGLLVAAVAVVGIGALNGPGASVANWGALVRARLVRLDRRPGDARDLALALRRLRHPAAGRRGVRGFPAGKAFRLMAAAILAGAGMYVVVVVLATGVVLPWRDLVAGEPVWATGAAVRVSLGTVGVAILSVAVVLAIFTGIHGFFMASSRLIFSMGRARLLPAWFGSIDRARGTPRNALLFTGAVSLLAPWFGREVIVWVVDMAAVGDRLRLPVHLSRGAVGGAPPAGAAGSGARRDPVCRVPGPPMRSRNARLHGARVLDRPGRLDRARRALLLQTRPGVRGNSRRRAGHADPRSSRGGR